jgi:hypothetical protein
MGQVLGLVVVYEDLLGTSYITSDLYGSMASDLCVELGHYKILH